MSRLVNAPPRIMVGATASEAGVAGYVPTPTAGNHTTQFLRKDGTFAVPAVTASGLAYSETPAGLVNGANATYTLANTPPSSAGVMVVLNGVVQYNGVGLDYTVSGTTITFAVAPASGSTIFAYYGSGSGIAFGTGVAAALALAIGTTGAVVLVGGTIALNVNGTVGATTPAAGAFTTLSASGLFDGQQNAFLGGISADTTELTQNLYITGGNWTYNSTRAGVLLQQDSSTTSFKFFTAPSGTGGTTAVLTQRAEITSTGLNATAIGATTPAAGAFTTLSATSNLVLTGGLAYAAGAIGTGGKQLIAGIDTTANIAYLRGASPGVGFWPLYLEGAEVRVNVGVGTQTVIGAFSTTGLAVTGTGSFTGAFGANGNAAQGKYTVNAASTDLATVVALCNQLRAALVANGIAV